MIPGCTLSLRTAKKPIFHPPFPLPPSLSILVPIFNEQRTLKEIMQLLTAACPGAQMIYIDDGSTDRSLEILRANARPQDLVLTKPNGGKGSAIRLGLSQATGAYTTVQDADLEYDPNEIASLLECAAAHPGEIVFGSRFLKPNPNIYLLYLLGNKCLTLIMNLLFRGALTDAYTCYKLFPTDVLKSLPLAAGGFELEAELCAYPLKRGLKIREVPITYHPRTFEDGKKICFSDAVRGLVTMVRIRSRSESVTNGACAPTR